MRLALYVSSVLLLFSYLVSLASETSTYKDKLSGQTYEIMILKNVDLGPKQSCENLSCMAAQIIGSHKMLKKDDIQTRKGGSNPASQVCLDLKGKSNTYLSAQGTEIAVCVFPDKSFLNSWDLIQKIRSEEIK